MIEFLTGFSVGVIVGSIIIYFGARSAVKGICKQNGLDFKKIWYK